MKLVMIEWVDSFGCSPSWESLSEHQPRTMTCRSVGWLLHDGEECKTLVPHIVDGEDQGCGDMTIPIRAVRWMVELTVPEQPEETKP